MANPDTPFGLKPVMDMHGRPYNGAKRSYYALATYGTALFIGDPVKLAGTSTTLASGRIVSNVQATATGDVPVGVIVGFAANPDNLSKAYRPASVAQEVFVCDDPNILFEIQEVSGGTALAAADIGLNANYVVAAGDANTGFSGVELNNSGEADTNTLDLKIVGVSPREDNVIGEHCKWLVRLNRHIFVNQIAGVA